MIFKKTLIIFLLAITAITLVGCSKPSYTVTVSANIEEASPTLSETYDRRSGQSVQLTTTEVEGYIFSYWHIVGETEQLSTELSFSYVPTKDVAIEAYYIEDGNPVITVSSSVLSIIITVNETLTTSGETQYDLIAPTHEDFTFVHWIDVDTNAVLSENATYSFVAAVSQSIRAIYELNDTPEPTLYYETSFEDADKAAYAIANVTLSSKDWSFNDALLGSLATDLKVSGKSVRIRDGYIQTLFTVEDLAQVVFYAGTYTNDTPPTTRFEVSEDGTAWITIDTFVPGTTLARYSYVFDSALITEFSLDADAAYYLRIVSETTSRTNIDDFSIYTGVGSVTSGDSLYTITFESSMKSSYLLGETVDLSGCVATHTVAGATTCDVSGTVNTAVAGVYPVIFSKTDEYNNTASETLNITVIDTGTIGLNTDLSVYYDDAEGLYGDALIGALHIIINDGFSGVTYGEARYILDETDVDPLNANNLILVYLGTSVSGYWDNGITWNREHVWPQSLLGEDAYNETVNMASDLYNLMPANPSENSSRGNNPYSELGLGYEPRDEVKGDVARALFYMMVMYDELELVNTSPGLHEMGYLDELLAWHYADPVDAFELNRLEVIYGEQNNRNPFVDYPHLVDLIWYYDN